MEADWWMLGERQNLIGSWSAKCGASSPTAWTESIIKACVIDYTKMATLREHTHTFKHVSTRHNDETQLGFKGNIHRQRVRSPNPKLTIFLHLQSHKLLRFTFWLPQCLQFVDLLRENKCKNHNLYNGYKKNVGCGLGASLIVCEYGTRNECELLSEVEFDTRQGKEGGVIWLLL